MNEILDFMRQYGLDPLEVIPDGKIHRFKADSEDKKNSAWYVGYSNHTVSSGEPFYVVVFGNYRTGETYTFQSDKVTYSSLDSKNIKDQIAKAKKTQEDLRDKLHNEVSRECTEIWNGLLETGSSPYLKRKQIDSCPNLNIRFDTKGNLYVPMRDIEGKIWSLQKIDWSGEKRFHAGGRVSGLFHVIGSIESQETIRIAEGFATGASVALATGDGIIVGVNASNLESVARDFKAKFPNKEFIIVGDDDCYPRDGKDQNCNIGREKAEDAARCCLGKAVFPEFKNRDTKPTDFNDLHCLEGIEEVKKQIISVKAGRHAVYALGFKEKEYFFTSTQNRQIIPITNFSETDFFNLMTVNYWDVMFPGKTNPDFSAAKSTLMDMCRKKGIFQGRNVRGAGVWNDEGRIVVNMGDHLIVDGEGMGLGEIKSKFFYTLGSNLHSLHSEPLTNSECDVLVNACDSFKWLKSDFSFLLAGALVISRICGALPIRPHIWLTGGAQTGKTTLMERLIKPMLGENALYVQGATSEAGVRQSLRSNAVPVVFDEFETTGQKSVENIASIIELARAAWSDSSAMIVKGGSSGNATAYQARFSAIVSSIRTALTNDADRSRFAIIELAPHGSDSEQWARLSSLLEKIDFEYGDRLFARTIRLVPVLLQNYKTLKSALAKKSSMRFGDQYGMLLAGYSILLSDETLSIEDANKLVDHVTLFDEKEEAKVTDHEDSLTCLLTKKLVLEIDREKREFSGSEAMSLAINDVRIKEALTRIGIKVVDLKTVAIAGNHSELEAQVYRGTRWSLKWAGSLARVDGAEKNRSVWFTGRNIKSVLLPLDKILTSN